MTTQRTGRDRDLRPIRPTPYQREKSVTAIGPAEAASDHHPGAPPAAQING
jgi:hypothetical protein